MTQQEANVTLKVNSKEAQQKLEQLQAQAAELRTKFADAFRRGDTRAITDINKRLQKVNKEMDNMRTNAANIRAAMVRLDKATPRELQRTIKMINNELNSGRVERGTKEWEQYVAQLKKAQVELKKVKAEMAVDDGGGVFEDIKDGINDWGATVAAAMGAFAGVVMSGKAAVQAYADMEGEMANVRKYTGMTAQEVEQLNEAFKEMDTRTSREELNQLAQEAGRLGKTSVEDVLGFVKAADQINVALDDLGDGATLLLSKLTGIFGDEARFGTEQSLLKVGSVINELSQNCSASAPYLAEFSSRIGGIAAQSKMTISQVMAFAAVLDTQNLAVEASATSVGQLITKIYQEPAKIAKATGLDVKQFSAMVKEDMNGALIALFEHLNKFGGMENLASVFDAMGTDGARAIPVLAALSGHIDELKQQQINATEAFEEGVSVTREFDVQNNTVQAQLDKAKKGFTEMAVSLGEKLLPVMRYCISGSSLLMRTIGVLVEFIIKYKKVILVTAAAVALYNGILKANVIWTKLCVTWTNLQTLAQTKLAGIGNVLKLVYAGLANSIQYFTNGLQVNYAMQQRWSKAMAAMTKANWVGLILSLAAAFYLWATRTKSVTTALDHLNDVRRKAQEQAQDEVDKIKMLHKVATDETAALDERRKAINELNRIVPKYNGYLDETTGQYRENKKALDDYVQSLIHMYEIQGAKEKLQELGKRRAQLRLDLADQQRERIRLGGQLTQLASTTSTPGNNISTTGTGSATALTNMFISGSIQAVDNKITDINNELAEIEETTQTLVQTFGTDLLIDNKVTTPTITDPETETVEPGLTDEDNALKAAKAALKKELEERQALYKQAQAENLALYLTGQRNYQDYCNTRTQLEQKYTDDVIAIHEKHNKVDMDGYSQALLSKQQLLEKQMEQQRKLSLRQLEQAKTDAEQAATLSFYDPNGELYQNQEALNMRLLDAEYEYLQGKLRLYKEGSDEYIATQREINNLLYKEQLEQQKRLQKAIEDYQKLNGDTGLWTKYQAELDALDLLLEKKLIKQEEYEQAVAKIRAKYRDIDMGATMQSANRIFTKLFDMLGSQGQYISAVLTSWLTALSEDERKAISDGFERGFNNVIGNTLLNGIDGVSELIQSFNDAQQGNWEGLIEDLGQMAQNAANIIGGVMQTFSNYWSAARDVEVAKTEKRYEAEIKAAGNNTKKVEKLEKEKEEEISKIKNKYNNRAMKMEIAQAVAQTAANALGAYGAMVKIPVVGPALAAAAAAAAIAAGAIQIATIKKQHEAEAAGYYEGGYTSKDSNNRRAVGVVHANEFVANHKAVANPAIAPVLNLIDQAQRNNTVGSLTTADVQRAIGNSFGVGAGGVTSAPQNDQIAASLALISAGYSQTGAIMTKLTDKIEAGIEAFVVMDGERGFDNKYTLYKKMQEAPKR